MARPKVLKDIQDIRDVNNTQDLDIDSLRESILVGKYHEVSSEISAIDSAVLTTNPLPTTWTGSDRSYTSGDYQIECNVSPSGANPLNNAFDGSTTSAYITTGALGGGDATPSITITLPSAITVTSFRTYILDNASLNSVTIQGSNNKSSWTTLRTFTSYDSGLSDKAISNPGSYRYYRFNFILDGTTGIVTVREIQISGYRLLTGANLLTLDNVPNPLALNQRITIKTPNFSNTGVTVTKFNNIDVDTVLLPNRYYELIYNGSIYLAKEVS